MKKKLIFVLVYALLHFSVIAQDNSTEKFRRHELGVDATYVLKSVVAVEAYYPYYYFDTTYAFVNPKFFNNQNPYILNYNFFINENLGLRAGFGFDRTDRKDKENRNNNYISGNGNQSIHITDVELIDKNTSLSGRAGLFYHVSTGNKWFLSIGGDFFMSQLNAENNYKYSNQNTNSSYSNSITTEKKGSGTSIGCGPVIGIKFNISNRISLHTEASLYYVKTTLKSDYKRTSVSTDSYSYNNSTSIQNGKTETTNNSVVLNLPFFIYLNVAL